MARSIEAVIFDWAGTTVDYGSMAPVTVFKKIFAKEGIELTKEQINKPMGLDKKTHIRLLLSMDEVAADWKSKKGSDWTEEDVERLYQDFETELAQVVAEYSTPIDGVVETVNTLRDMGLKIGSTTGYTSEMMKNVKDNAAELGYDPDCIITPDIAGGGRPSPYMLFEAMKEMGLYSTDLVVKVGDTISDIEEGKNAGSWAVGLLQGSNLMGLEKEEYDALNEEELEALKKETVNRYLEAGADFVADSIKNLPGIIQTINGELLNQEKVNRG